VSDLSPWQPQHRSVSSMAESGTAQIQRLYEMALNAEPSRIPDRVYVMSFEDWRGVRGYMLRGRLNPPIPVLRHWWTGWLGRTNKSFKRTRLADIRRKWRNAITPPPAEKA